MGHHSNAATKCLNNLQQTTIHKKATIEDVKDDNDYSPPALPDTLKHSFFFLDEDSDSDSDLEKEGDEEDIEEELISLRNKEALHHFATTLTESQKVAAEAERAAASNRLHHYTRNSKCSQRRHAFNCKVLAATGQQFVSNMFTSRTQNTTETKSTDKVASMPHDDPFKKPGH
ncbi:unnamed protein product [Cyclocybe aegerita]|uniref:Uncharacterized protein n=1 Tax=Cyclocybe aegerita TaxID=1973307 RepID=A0A8S0VUJ7_CYCAE|nr:unnamed protein product [Cyclocybe aegerita]